LALREVAIGSFEKDKLIFLCIKKSDYKNLHTLVIAAGQMNGAHYFSSDIFLL